MKEAVYIKGSTNVSDVENQLPTYLLLGRSNVGKSSFINALTNRKALARTSGTPGKTIVLNYYLINSSFYLVDAPGYGYAKRSKSMQNEFIGMIDNVIHNHPKIISVLLLIDFKVGPTNDDLEIYDYLLSIGIEVNIVATKKDKIPKTRQYKQEKEIKKVLNNPINFYSVSNTTKDSIDKIREKILQGVEGYESH
ncbi:ribosome biogenesis GTP-binding protein YihA/YsxC [Haploplasma axanthum]|uniref:Probable GTP-binding protein EngB n=1 Tax=Haploplasma axanthum TaxID=29552 RepID=A0A449BE63_HAPAX|nr:ribosome biogenesis GTP-binding protein YihA/YsxC [Haploplasma axanthum]VEU80739.1 GTPase EngB [Haploplasma axanthum]